MVMRKITKIDNLFNSAHKLTTSVIPLEILHPEIETKIIEQYGDKASAAWIIRVLCTKTSIFVPYVCITSTVTGNMYQVEYITVNHSEAYMSGYNTAAKEYPVGINPYKHDCQEFEDWIKGYEAKMEELKDLIPY